MRWFSTPTHSYLSSLYPFLKLCVHACLTIMYPHSHMSLVSWLFPVSIIWVYYFHKTLINLLLTSFLTMRKNTTCIIITNQWWSEWCQRDGRQKFEVCWRSLHSSLSSIFYGCTILISSNISFSMFQFDLQIMWFEDNRYRELGKTEGAEQGDTMYIRLVMVHTYYIIFGVRIKWCS